MGKECVSNCCDCGVDDLEEGGCEFSYCWSCNACEVCLGES